MNSRIQLHVCEHFRDETLAVLAMETDLKFQVDYFPVHCTKPATSRSELGSTKTNNLASDEPTLHVYLGSICVANLEKHGKSSDVMVFHHSQCFDLIIPEKLSEHLIMSGAYLCSPGWLKNWRTQLEEMGNRQDIVREMFQTAANRIILLDTGVGEHTQQLLRDLSEYLGIPSEVLPVGLAHFRLQLLNILLKCHSQNLDTKQDQISRVGQQKTADYAMALDLLSTLPSFESETVIVEKLIFVVSMLFAPTHYHILTLSDGKPKQLWQNGEQTTDEQIEQRLLSIEPLFGLSADQQGFFFKIGDDHNPDAIVEIVACEELAHVQHYLNLSISIRNVMALALNNARIFTREQETNRQLSEALESIKVLRGIIPICSYCKQIRTDQGSWQKIEQYICDHSDVEFSHGICPNCIDLHFKEYADDL